nr:transposase and inactivated derivatives [Bradyrhizobium sp. DOA9]
MQRRKFSREFKVEAVKLGRERGVSAAQAGRDLDVDENVLRKWVNEFGSDPVQAFPGHGQMKAEQQEIERLRREVAKLKAERNILKWAAAFFREGRDMKFVFVAPGDLAGGMAIRRAEGFGGSRQALLPATGPTAHGASGETFWQTASSAVCIGSSG